MRLAKDPIELIFSSPLERAIETAVPLAKRLGLDIQISDALNEIDVKAREVVLQARGKPAASRPAVNARRNEDNFDPAMAPPGATPR